jgi:hypothetical protein
MVKAKEPTRLTSAPNPDHAASDQQNTNGLTVQQPPAPASDVVPRFARSLSGAAAPRPLGGCATRPPRPKADAPRFKNMPTELVALDQWVMWRYEWRDGRWTKVPFQTNGQRAKHNDPKTWCAFAAAQAAYERGSFDGVGFVFAADDDFVFIDFDKVIPPDGSLDQKYERYIDISHSFAERSVSHTGFHILGRGKLPPRLDDPTKFGRKRPPVELYDRLRFGVMTGSLIAPLPLADIQPLINEIIETYWPEESSRASAPAAASEPELESLTDQAVIDAILSSTHAALFQKLLSEYAGEKDAAGNAVGLPLHGPANLDHTPSGYDQWFGRICCQYGATVDQAIRIWQGSTLYSRIEQKNRKRKSDHLTRRLRKLRDKSTNKEAKRLPATLEWASNIKEVVMNWLVPGRIARGVTTMLCGDGGLGKTYSVQDLAARVSQGEPYGPSGLNVPRGAVLYVGDEDAEGFIAIPRLRAAGADLSRIAFSRNIEVFPDDIEALASLAQQISAVLIVIEPLDSFIKNADRISHNSAAMRSQVYKRLKWLAETLPWYS